MTDRYDDQGRRLCNAPRRDGEPCNAPAITNGPVCFKHGGNLPVVKAAAARRALEELVDPALVKLTDLIADTDTPHAVLLAAIRDILDRAGLAAPKKLEVLTLDVLDKELARLDAEIAALNDNDPDDG